MSKQSQPLYQSKLLKLTVCSETNENVRIMSTTHQISKLSIPTDVTKTLATGAVSNSDVDIERSLKRSSTFVCDEPKLLSSDASNSSQFTDQTHSLDYKPKQNTSKERTKRSLSPILSDGNAAKRKSVQSIVKQNAITASSTPRYSNDSDTKFIHIGKMDKQCESLEMKTFLLDSTISQFDSTNRSNISAVGLETKSEETELATKIPGNATLLCCCC